MNQHNIIYKALHPLTRQASTKQQVEYWVSILVVAGSLITSSGLPFHGNPYWSLAWFIIFIATLVFLYEIVKKFEDKKLIITKHPIGYSTWITIVTTPVTYTVIYSIFQSSIPLQSALAFIFGLLSLKYVADIDSKRILLKKLNTIHGKINNISDFVGWTSMIHLKSSIQSNISKASTVNSMVNCSNSFSSQISSLSSSFDGDNKYRSNISSAVKLLSNNGSLYSTANNAISTASNNVSKAASVLNKNR